MADECEFIGERKVDEVDAVMQISERPVKQIWIGISGVDGVNTVKIN